MTALVTGSAGGIGSAIVRKLVAEGFHVRELDLTSGFDVSDPSAWEHVGSVDLACLNAGVITGDDGRLTDLTDDRYRRALGVNVDGVVFGVRRLDRVMPRGSTIVYRMPSVWERYRGLFIGSATVVLVEIPELQVLFSLG